MPCAGRGRETVPYGDPAVAIPAAFGLQHLGIMKAARIHAYGHSDQIQVEDVAIPDPKPDEVLVRILAAGINPIDWKIREGALAAVEPARFPLTLGQDFAGTVLAVGPQVLAVDLSLNEAVYGFAHGAYAEYASVSPHMIATKPATIDLTTAATLPTPGVTALHAVAAIDPRPGQTLLIHGAAGAVGSIATELVVWRGAHVIANASSADATYLEHLGVVQVIDHATTRFEDVAGDVDGVLDFVGGDTLARSYDLVRRGGSIVTILGPIDDARAARRGIRVWNPMTRADRAARIERSRADLEQLANLVDRGIVTPRALRVLPLDQVREGQDLSRSGRAGKLVLATT